LGRRPGSSFLSRRAPDRNRNPAAPALLLLLRLLLLAALVSSRESLRLGTLLAVTCSAPRMGGRCWWSVVVG